MRKLPRHVQAPARRRPPVAAARTTTSTTTTPMLELQRRYGNRAVTTLVGPAGVQRAVGWPEAKGANKAPMSIPGQKMVRIPLAGLAGGNRSPAPNTDKTDELAGDKSGGRAIVWIHPNLALDRPVQILVHLHGLTSRAVDPFPGWRETHGDPKASEVDPARQAAKKARKPFSNPLAHKVRDIERDRIGQQVEALNDPQVMAILPQGTGLGGADAFGKDLDPAALADEVLARLTTEKILTKVPKTYTIVLSAHSGGAAAVRSVLTANRTGRIGGLILFDALHGRVVEVKGKKTFGSGQRDAVLAWIRANCDAVAPTLKDATKSADEKSKAVDALPGLRGYWESGYSSTYADLQDRIDRIVKATIPAAYVPAVKKKFVVTKVATSHDRIVGGTGGTGVEAGPLQDALAKRGTFVARTATPAVQRSTPTNATPLPPVLDGDRKDNEKDFMHFEDRAAQKALET